MNHEYDVFYHMLTLWMVSEYEPQPTEVERYKKTLEKLRDAKEGYWSYLAGKTLTGPQNE